MTSDAIMEYIMGAINEHNTSITFPKARVVLDTDTSTPEVLDLQNMRCVFHQE